MTYDFPEITVEGDLYKVLEKVREETNEIHTAILNGETPDRICEEIADLCQVVETFHRRATALYGANTMAIAKAFTEIKCRRRGYYDARN